FSIISFLRPCGSGLVGLLCIRTKDLPLFSNALGDVGEGQIALFEFLSSLWTGRVSLQIAALEFAIQDTDLQK
ncbi:MAG: hypothetical protein LQ347_004937, partial [Umbilicaria vellea]